MKQTSPNAASLQAESNEAHQEKGDRTKNISYTQEILRKMIHLCSLSIPIIYSYIDRTTALILLSCIFIPFFGGDIARRFIPALNRLVHRFFGGMMRPHELDEKRFLLNGATYVLLSALLCVIVFPKVIAITAFSILIVSDISSALIGRKFGKTPFFDKSLQGTMAFWITAWGVVGVIASLAHAPLEYVLIGSVAAFFGGIVEAASTRLKMDDNFSIPLSVGCLMWLLVFGIDAGVREQILSLFVNG